MMMLKDVVALPAPTSDNSPYALHNVRKQQQQQSAGIFGRMFSGSKGQENLNPNIVSNKPPPPSDPALEAAPTVVGSYYAPMANEPTEILPEVLEYNQQFANCLEAIKRRHDPVVSTVGRYRGDGPRVFYRCPYTRSSHPQPTVF